MNANGISLVSWVKNYITWVYWGGGVLEFNEVKKSRIFEVRIPWNQNEKKQNI